MCVFARVGTRAMVLARPGVHVIDRRTLRVGNRRIICLQNNPVIDLLSFIISAFFLKKKKKLLPFQCTLFKFFTCLFRRVAGEHFVGTCVVWRITREPPTLHSFEHLLKELTPKWFGKYSVVLASAYLLLYLSSVCACAKLMIEVNWT